MLPPNIHYEQESISAIIAPMINNGNARYNIPPTTIPTRITGKNMTVQRNFIIPQDAFNPNIKNFPINQIKQITNNTDNIFYSFLPYQIKHCLLFFCVFVVNSEIFLTPSLLLNSGFLSIFSIERITLILCATFI